jgi:Fe2+ or Zn2+ uptake regulation protein
LKNLSQNQGLWLDEAAFGQACRKAGLADTTQRRLIYRVLAESFDHPTAETVHKRVGERLSRVSLATVYRNLKAFADSGMADEVAVGGYSARYDANKLPHQHLVCRSCGQVRDYTPDPDSDSPRAPASSALDGFEVDSAKINWFGICAECAAARPSERKELDDKERRH